MLTQVLPFPLDAGPKVRAYHVLRWLARHADVHLVTFSRTDDRPEATEHLRTLCTEVITIPMARSRAKDAIHLARALVSDTSFIIVRDGVDAMRKCLARLVADRRFDAVHADQLWMAQYARDLPIPFKVLDEHNAVYRIFERLAVGEISPLKRNLLRREARQIKRYELAQLEAFDRTLFVTEDDRAAIRACLTADTELDPGSFDERTLVLPICVDVEGRPVILVRPDAHRITVLGTMFWPPNAEGVLWFAEQVLPQVLREVPNTVFTVIGKNPSPAIRRLADRFGSSVEITGYVADPRAYLEETAVFLVPLLSGGGMRVKILDAWLWGLPVLSTTIGAEGIDLRPGTEALIADSPEAMSEGAVCLLTQPALGRRIGLAGRAAVKERYDARQVYRRLESVYGPVFNEAGSTLSSIGSLDNRADAMDGAARGPHRRSGYSKG